MAKSAPLDCEKMREQACLWLAKLDRGLREQEGDSLREWLTHPRNRSAILEAARLWHDPGVTSVLARLFPGSPELADAPQKRPDILLTSIFGVAAACLSFVTVIGLSNGFMPWKYFLNAPSAPITVPPMSYATAVGERRQVVLADRSNLTLNTGTALAVVFTTVSRDVYLRSGEASFHVARETARPFRVRAGNRWFQASGTDFDLRVLTPDDVQLTVAEGSVRVLYEPPAQQDTPSQARLRANVANDDTTIGALQTVLVEPGFEFARTLDSSGLQAHRAWHQGMLVFNGETLDQAVAEAARYTPVRFVIPDDKLRATRIKGAFRIGDLGSLLRSLRADLSIDWQLDAQGRVELIPLSPDCTHTRRKCGSVPLPPRARGSQDAGLVLAKWRNAAGTNERSVASRTANRI
jgi:transmembrane sensor